MTFQHRAGVSPYTSPCGFARTCVFSKQSLPPGLCDPHPQPARGLRVRAPLLPKLRGRFAEFLHRGSPVRLGMLCPTTCVGLGYGRTGPSRRGFSRRLRITLLPRPEGRVTVAPHPRHLRQPPGFAWAAGCALERAEPSDPRGHHCASPLLIRLPTCAEGPQTPAAPPPAGPKTGTGGHRIRAARGVGQHPRVGTVGIRSGTGISTRHPSTTPVGLALGPDSPRADQPGPGTLGHTALGLPTPVSLLMPAFSLPRRPPPVTRRLPPARDAPLPPAAPHRPPTGGGRAHRGGSAASAARLSPAQLSAHDHLTSELLRTLSRMAASEPTSWLSPRPHILSHLARA